MKNKIYQKIITFYIILGILLSPLGLYNMAHASLRTSPTWYDLNTLGSNDWHYRVPIVTASNTVINSTVSVDVDFTSLLSALGVSGKFDVNSPRIIRPNGTIVSVQEFNQTIYNGLTDSSNTRGNIRFITQDAGTQNLLFIF